jgi:hypothetical protein
VKNLSHDDSTILVNREGRKYMARYGFVALGLVALLGCASGSAIVVGQTRPRLSSEKVKIYLEPPPSYETIAVVRASSDAGFTEQGSIDYAVNELKEQAAKVGANGVLLTGSGTTTSAVLGGGTASFYAIPIAAQVLEGKAIYVGDR